MGNVLYPVDITQVLPLATTPVQTGRYYANPGELVRCDTTGGSFTVYLPLTPAAGATVTVRVVAAGASNTVTVACRGTDVIDTALTSSPIQLADESLTYIYDGAGHWTIAGGRKSTAALDGRYGPAAGSTAWLTLHAGGDLDALLVGAITRDANGAATSAGAVWPDGTTGTYTATTLSTAFPGAVDAYTVTYGTKTVIQPLVTRDPATGAVTNRPAMTVS